MTRPDFRRLLALLVAGNDSAANQFWITSDLSLADFHEAMAMVDRKKREDDAMEALGMVAE